MPQSKTQDIDAYRSERAARSEIVFNSQGRSGFVYVMQMLNYLKIGKSIDPIKRQKGVQTHCPEEVLLLREIPTADMAKLEMYLHFRFHDQRTRGEWFLLLPEQREWLLAVPTEELAALAEQGMCT